MNGLPPPHLIAPHLYPNNATNQVDAQVEMWGVHPKTAPTGDNMPQNMEQKVVKLHLINFTILFCINFTAFFFSFPLILLEYNTFNHQH